MCGLAKRQSNSDKKPAIVIHGGAINPTNEVFNKGVSEAAVVAMKIMENKGSSLDAVTKAIETMENNPIFNSGTGSWPNLSGEIEMDAIIMDGKTLKAGAVGCIKKVKNPILVAKKVMEDTDHILLVGDGAVKFARGIGFKEYDPMTRARKTEWQEMLSKLKQGEKLPMFEYWDKLKKFANDTVGAVAIDENGDISAGTSSGGFPMKLPGRVGDVPLIGCSTYAQNSIGGVSITGHGEVVMRQLLAKRIIDDLESGHSIQTLIEDTVRRVSLGENRKILLGIVAMDKDGNIGAARNTELTPHAYFYRGMKKPNINFMPIIK